MNHDQARDLLAELALDVIADDDRKGVESHIADCEICELEGKLYIQATALLPIAALAGPRDIDADALDRIRAVLLKDAQVHVPPRPRLKSNPPIRAPHADAISVHAPHPQKERGLRGVLRRGPAEARHEDDDFSSDLFADVTPLTEEEVAIRNLERDWDDDGVDDPGRRLPWRRRRDAPVALAPPVEAVAPAPPRPAPVPPPQPAVLAPPAAVPAPVARLEAPPVKAPLPAPTPAFAEPDAPAGPTERKRGGFGFGRLRRQAGRDEEGSDADFSFIALPPPPEPREVAPLAAPEALAPRSGEVPGAPSPERVDLPQELSLESPVAANALPGDAGPQAAPETADAVLAPDLAASVDLQSEPPAPQATEAQLRLDGAGAESQQFPAPEPEADLAGEALAPAAARGEPSKPPAPAPPAARPAADPFAFVDDLITDDDFGGDGPHLDGEGDDGARRAPPGPSTRRRGLGRARRGHHEHDDDWPAEAGADAFGVPPDLGEEPSVYAGDPGRRRFLNRIREESQAELVTAIPEFRGDRALDDAIHLAVAPTILAVPGVTSPMPGTILSKYDPDEDDEAEEDDAVPVRRAEFDEDDEGEDAGSWRAWTIMLGIIAVAAIAGLGYTFFQLRETRDEANVLQQKVQSFAVQIGLRGDDFTGIAYMLPTYNSGIIIFDGIPSLPPGREYVVWAEGSEGIKNIRAFQPSTPSRTYVDLGRMPPGFRRIFITEEGRSRSGLRVQSPSGQVLVDGFPPVR
ncbi:MAG: hypothetical protein ACKVVT_12500 [Dehalococcoidia bacterium]